MHRAGATSPPFSHIGFSKLYVPRINYTYHIDTFAERLDTVDSLWRDPDRCTDQGFGRTGCLSMSFMMFCRGFLAALNIFVRSSSESPISWVLSVKLEGKYPRRSITSSLTGRDAGTVQCSPVPWYSKGTRTVSILEVLYSTSTGVRRVP